MKNLLKLSSIFLSLILFSSILSGCQNEDVTLKVSSNSANESSAKKEEKAPESASIEEEATKAPDQNVNPSKPPTEIVHLDNDWNLYKNNKLGFSLKIPKESFFGFGGCKKETNSYRPDSEMVPLKVFENGNKVYISFEYFYKLTGETKEGSEETGYISNYSGCEKIENNLAYIENDPKAFSWEITIEGIKNDKELDTYIKERYGKGCSLDAQEAAKDAKIYDVIIKGDGKGMDDTECPVNYITVLKYSPDAQKIANWDIGQDSTFWADMNNPFDMEMSESFIFE